MKAYDLCVPLYDNDGRPVALPKFHALQQHPEQFGGLTFFPQPNEGFWTLAGVTEHFVLIFHLWGLSWMSVWKGARAPFRYVIE